MNSRAMRALMMGILSLTAAWVAWTEPMRSGVSDSNSPSDAGQQAFPLELRRGSNVGRDAGYRAGATTRPRTQAEASIVARVHHALSRIPESLRPKHVVLDFDVVLQPGAEAIRGVEFHSVARSLLVGSDAEQLGVEVWLHELAHVRMQGSRPSGIIAKRLLTAAEEGVADYYAATIAGTARLGPLAGGRDLSSPPRVGSSEWAALAFASFDSHRMGSGLGALLYRVEPRYGTVLEDVVSCFDAESNLMKAAETPQAALNAFLLACPPRSRARFASLLSAWLPRELFPNELEP